VKIPKIWKTPKSRDLGPGVEDEDGVLDVKVKMVKLQW